MESYHDVLKAMSIVFGLWFVRQICVLIYLIQRFKSLIHNQEVPLDPDEEEMSANMRANEVLLRIFPNVVWGLLSCALALITGAIGWKYIS
jgi:hypothetical protein